MSGLGTINDLSEAIAKYEGYYTDGSPAQQNNNPGNIRSWGNYPVVNGFVKFPDAATGWSALNRQVALNISRGLTLNQFFAGIPGGYKGYAPAKDNNKPSVYAATVASWLGIDPNTPLNQIDSASITAPAADSEAGISADDIEESGFVTTDTIAWLAAGAIFAAILYFILQD